MTDFSRNQLRVTPLELDPAVFQKDLIFTHLVPFTSDSFLVLGGYHTTNIARTHNLCYKVDVETKEVTKVDAKMESMESF